MDWEPDVLDWSHRYLGRWNSEVPRGWKWLVSVINAIFVTLYYIVDDFLPVQLIYQRRHHAATHTTSSHPDETSPTPSNIGLPSLPCYRTSATSLCIRTWSAFEFCLVTENPRLSQSAISIKGQGTASVNALLEEHDIHVCLLPSNSHRSISTNGHLGKQTCKRLLHITGKFQEWYIHTYIFQPSYGTAGGPGLRDVRDSTDRAAVLKENGYAGLSTEKKVERHNDHCVTSRTEIKGTTSAVTALE